MKTAIALTTALLSAVITMVLPPRGYAAHPLVTEDVYILGRGNFEFELSAQYSSDDQSTSEALTATSRSSEVRAALKAGLAENVDLLIGVPYQWVKESEEEILSDGRGFSDVLLQARWRFLEKNGLGLGLLPGISLPVGNEEKGLGAGRVTYSLFFIASKEIEPWNFHFNAGYARNENKLDERENLWRLSLAAEFEVIRDLRLVADIGAQRNPDRESNQNPAFVLGGVIYSLAEWADLDVGIKAGLNEAEADYTLLAGITVRF
jgi:hypothetical protein